MLISLLALAMIFICCLILSAVFSGSEIAFFSLAKWQLVKMDEDKVRNVGMVETLLERSDDLLNGILVGNLIVNVAAASSATFLSHYLLQGTHLFSDDTLYFVDTLVVTVLILIIGEISPKVFAVDNPEMISARTAPFLKGWLMVTKPLLVVLSILTSAAKKIFGSQKKPPRYTEEELVTTVSTTIDNGDLSRIMLQKMFTFADTMANEIMVPRTKMLCIEETTPLERAIEIVKDIEHSRVPLYRGNLDRITGVLYARDLLGKVFGFEGLRSLEEIKKPAHFVPESKKVHDLLREFQIMKVHMAIVVDEYGGTAGLVTLEDVIEEIVGEIQDEYDREEPELVRVREGIYLVDGLMGIDDFQEALGVEIKGEGFETMGGYILSLMGKIPEQGDELTRGGLTFRVYRVAGKRVSKLIVRRIPQKKEGEEGKGVTPAL
jgi:CBS domain containing-hemolysin-like protein